MKRFSRLRVAGFVSIFCLLVFGVVDSGRFSRAAAQQREFEVRTYKDMPVMVQEVRNLQAGEDTWFRDLQIVVKNISDKPIYFISMSVRFPDMAPRSSSTVIGFNLHYGRVELGDVRVRAGSADVPILPGDTYAFTIPSYRVRGYESMMKRRPIEQARRLMFGFEMISFGDQTGFPVAGIAGLMDFRGKAVSQE